MLTQYCKAKKILFFPEILVARNIFTQMTANLFFQSIFQIYYLVFFSFFSFFYYFFVCCFLKLKMCIVIHIQLCGRVSIKEIFTQPIFRNKTTFFCTRNVSSMYTTERCPNVCTMRMTVSGFLWTLSWHQHIHWTWLYTDMNDPDKF